MKRKDLTVGQEVMVRRYNYDSGSKATVLAVEPWVRRRTTYGQEVGEIGGAIVPANLVPANVAYDGRSGVLVSLGKYAEVVQLRQIVGPYVEVRQVVEAREARFRQEQQEWQAVEAERAATFDALPLDDLGIDDARRVGSTVSIDLDQFVALVRRAG